MDDKAPQGFVVAASVVTDVERRVRYLLQGPDNAGRTARDRVPVIPPPRRGGMELFGRNRKGSIRSTSCCRSSTRSAIVRRAKLAAHAGPSTTARMGGMARRQPTVALDEGLIDLVRRVAERAGIRESEVYEQALRRLLADDFRALLAEIEESQRAAGVSLSDSEGEAFAYEELKAHRAEHRNAS